MTFIPQHHQHCQVTTYEEAWSDFDLLQPGQVSTRVPWSKGQGKKSQQCKPSIRHLLYVLEHGSQYNNAQSPAAHQTQSFPRFNCSYTGIFHLLTFRLEGLK